MPSLPLLGFNLGLELGQILIVSVFFALGFAADRWLHVRRRDITDIFLGTGLGARAYAIIEQGMISRIIEAKPEELRVFLEEAAGIENGHFV